MSELGVIIPACEGAQTLGGVLDALAAQDVAQEMNVVVVINGPINSSRYETLRVAHDHAGRLHSAGHRCRVTTSRAGRGHAIRVAEPMLGPGPRAFVDCDAILSNNAMRELLESMQPGEGVHFAVPRLVVARSQSIATRACYATWQALPYVRESPVTFGVYAVSEKGRERWREPPLIHSDDKFARLHFQPHERAITPSATYEVPAPSGLRALVAARKRYLAGNRELATRFPHLTATDMSRHQGIATAVLGKPSLWPSSAVFAAVYAAAAVRDKWQF